MAVSQIMSADELKEKIATGPSIVDFYLTWYGPCKQLASRLHKQAEDTRTAAFLKVDVDELQEMEQTYIITLMPTILGFKDGAVIDRVVGADERLTKNLLQKLTE
ncbi:unnamed protein product [Dibothriocephalus latus]|uniref:Thioredoxin n=1 Tax=Dibothriocephalus latus TaxID=60516 RepID=A0A3P7P1Q8_DIBLA|nr:unnamed protein product [Dibothriocephalus latus]